jgi:hypothetical protein
VSGRSGALSCSSTRISLAHLALSTTFHPTARRSSNRQRLISFRKAHRKKPGLIYADQRLLVGARRFCLAQPRPPVSGQVSAPGSAHRCLAAQKLPHTLYHMKSEVLYDRASHLLQVALLLRYKYFANLDRVTPSAKSSNTRYGSTQCHRKHYCYYTAQ